MHKAQHPQGIPQAETVAVKLGDKNAIIMKSYATQKNEAYPICSKMVNVTHGVSGLVGKLVVRYDKFVYPH